MLYQSKYTDLIEAGCDEAGRGCLAGPVYAAAVIIHPDADIQSLNDSKKLSPDDREQIRQEIEQKARSWAVASVDNTEIDSINILNASYRAMHRAIDQLTIVPDYLMIDGNRFQPYQNIAYECIVGGDAIYQSIAAASILAKTWRDEYMVALAKEYTHYEWGSNKGYPTPPHRKAIQKYGPSPYHRQSFRLYPSPKQGNIF